MTLPSALLPQTDQAWAYLPPGTPTPGPRSDLDAIYDDLDQMLADLTRLLDALQQHTDPGRATLLALLPKPDRMSPAQRRTADRIVAQGRPFDIIIRTY